jgi:streptogramin lyase
MIWIGTGAGLLTHDGVSFRAIPGPSHVGGITALHEAPDGTCWAGYDDGHLATVTMDTLRMFEPEEGTPAVAITGMLTDRRGVFWVATYGEGIYYLDGGRFYNLNTDDGLADNVVYSLRQGPGQAVWACTDQGVSICEVSRAQKHVTTISMARGLPDNIVRDVWFSGDSVAWLGLYDYGVCRYRIADSQLTPVPAPWTWGPVRRIQSVAGEVWVMTDHDELVVLSPDDLRVQRHFRLAGSAAHLRDMMQDDEGNLWLAGQAGLFRLYPYVYWLEDPAGITRQNIRAVQPDSAGGGWIAAGGSLYQLSPLGAGWSITRRLTGVSGAESEIISLYEDPTGDVWAGTYGVGLYRFAAAGGPPRRYTTSDGLMADNTLAMGGHGDERWMATSAGVTYGRLQGDGSYRFTNAATSSLPGITYVYDILADRQGRVWFGTDGKGLAYRDQGDLRQVAATQAAELKVIYGLAEDTQGHIWATTAHGVLKLAGDSLAVLGPAQGLTTPDMQGIARDVAGNILLLHTNGLDIVSTREGTVTRLGAYVGLSDLTPDLNTLQPDGQGRVWIGTERGLLIYTPLPDTYRRRPRLLLDRILINLKEQAAAGQQIFRWNENYLTFQFKALWYQEPAAVQYQYQLVGYDLDWVNTLDRAVTYAQLKPGTYTLRLRASLPEQWARAEIVTYAFQIRPPFWQTPWFVLGIILLFGTALYFFISTREKRLRRAAQLEQENIRFELETLRNQVNPHFLFNAFNTLVSLIEDNPRHAVNYVNRLSDFFRNMLEYRGRDLITLRRELDLLDDYRYLLQERYGDALRLEIDLKPETLDLGIPPLTLQMLIENAVKHNVITHALPLVITLTAGDNTYLEVRNPIRKKRTPPTSTRLGLANIRQRYHLLSQLPVVIHEDDAVFAVSVPLLPLSDV